MSKGAIPRLARPKSPWKDGALVLLVVRTTSWLYCTRGCVQKSHLPNVQTLAALDTTFVVKAGILKAQRPDREIVDEYRILHSDSATAESIAFVAVESLKASHLALAIFLSALMQQVECGSQIQSHRT